MTEYIFTCKCLLVYKQMIQNDIYIHSKDKN